MELDRLVFEQKLLVLILVLMECGWNPEKEMEKILKSCLNPCSNGMWLESAAVMMMVVGFVVLILVLMECGWNRLRGDYRHFFTVLILVLMECGWNSPFHLYSKKYTFLEYCSLAC